MSTDQKPAAASLEKTQFTKAFYTNDTKGASISLLIQPGNEDFAPKKPAFFGFLTKGEGDAKVEKSLVAFVQPAGKNAEGKDHGAFMSLSIRGAKKEDGTYEKDTRFGTGNMQVTKEGWPRLVVNPADGSPAIWLSPRKEITLDSLAKLGLNMDRLAEVQAGLAAKAPASEAEKPKSPKP